MRMEDSEPGSVNEKQRESHVIDLVGAHHAREIGYMVLPDYWWNGYAAEALQAWMTWYWKAYPGGCEKRDCYEGVDGTRGGKSRKVLQKCGFTWRCESQKEVE